MTGPTGTLLSILLPWLLGSAWLSYLFVPGRHWNWWLVIGYGYLVGLFLTTLVLQAWSLTGLALDFAGIAATLGVLSLVGAGLRWSARAGVSQQRPHNAVQSGELAFCGILLLLVFWRYSTIFQEVLTLPLYPWDAWMNWAPKAVVWFHFGELVDYVSPEDWLQAPASRLDYTLGAYEAWRYPDGIPLIQLWGMLAVNSADSGAVYLPWAILPLALGCVLYGHLRVVDTPRYLAVSAAYLLVSMPFINVHAALAGYADLWVAAAFGCGVFAVITWDRTREWPFAALALVMAAFCTQLKVPGLIMAAIVCGLLLVSLPRASGLRRVALFTLLFLTALLVFIFGVDMDLPWLGRIVISRSLIAIPYVGEFAISYQPVHHALLNTFFLMINWNMAWYLLVAALLCTLAKPRLLADNFLVLVSLVGATVFILFVYYFTKRYKYALDYTQINRAVIYLVPLAVYFTTTIWHQLTAYNASNTPPQADAGEPSPAQDSDPQRPGSP